MNVAYCPECGSRTDILKRDAGDWVVYVQCSRGGCESVYKLVRGDYQGGSRDVLYELPGLDWVED